MREQPTDSPLNTSAGALALSAMRGSEKPALDVHGSSSHFWSETETAAYVEWINSQLSDDPELGAYLPVSKAGTGLFQACRDGVLLSKLVNKSVPFTIDENRINKKPKSPIHMSENLQKVLNGARAIGCQVHNLGPEDIKNAVPHLCLGLIWQVIKIGLLCKVGNTMRLAAGMEDANFGSNESVNSSSGKSGNTASKNEKVLLMWFNLRLEESECPKKANNFGNDLSDSVCLSYLVNHLSPDNLKLQFNIGEVLSETNLSRRAELMLQAAERIGCRQFTSPADIVAGNKNLNMAFVAVLYTAESEKGGTSAERDVNERKLRKDVNDKDSLIKSLQEQLDGANKLINQLRSENTTQEGDLQAIRRQLDSLQNTSKKAENAFQVELQGLQGLLEQKTTELTGLMQNLQQSQSGASARETALKSELRTAQDLVTQQDGEIQGLKRKLNTSLSEAQGNNSLLKNDLREVEDTLAQREAELRSIKLQLTSAQSGANANDVFVRAELRETKEQLAEKETELRNAKLALSSLQASSGVTEEHLRNELQSIQDEAAEKERDLAYTRDKAKDMERLLAVTEGENISLRAQIKGLQSGNERSETESASYNSKLKAVEDRLLNSERALGQTKAELEAAREKLARREKRVAELEASEQSLKNKVEAVEKSNWGITGELTLARSETERTQKANAKLQEELRNMERKLSEAESMRSSLQSNLDQAKTRSDKAERTAAEKEEDLRLLGDKMQAIERSLEASHSEAIAVRELNTSLQQARDRDANQISSLRDQLALTASQIGPFAAQIKAKEQEILLLRNVGVEKDSVIESLRSQIDEVRKRARELEDQLSSTQERAKASDRKADDLTQKLRDLQNRLDASEADADQLKIQANMLRDENSLLQSSSKLDFSQEISKLKQQYEDLLSDARREATEQRQAAVLLQEKLNENQDEVDRLEGRLAAEEERGRVLAEDLDVTRSENERLVSETAIQKSQLAATEEQLSAIKAQIETQEEEASTTRADLEKLRQELEDIVREAGVDPELQSPAKMDLAAQLRLLKKFSSSALSEAANQGQEVFSLKNRLDEAESTIRRLESDLSRKESELEKVVTAQQDAERSLNEIGERHRVALNDVTNVLQESDSIVRELRKKLTSAEGELESLKERLGAAESEAQGAKQVAKLLKQESALMMRENAEKQNEADQARRAFFRAASIAPAESMDATKLKALLDEKEREIESLNAQLTEREKINVDLQHELDIVADREEEANHLREQAAANEAMISSLRNLLEEGEANLRDVQGKRRALQDELRIQLRSIGAEKSGDTDADIIRQIGKLKKSKEETDDENETLRKKNEANKGLLERLAKEVADGNARLDSLIQKLSSAEQRADVANAHTAQLKTQISQVLDLQEAESDTQHLIQQLAAIKSVSNAAAQNIGRETNQQEQTANQLQQKLAVSEAQINRLKAQLQEAESQAQKAQAEVQLLRAELDRMFLEAGQEGVREGDLLRDLREYSAIAARGSSKPNDDVKDLLHQLDKKRIQELYAKDELDHARGQLIRLEGKIKLLDESLRSTNEVMDRLKGENRSLKDTNARLFKDSQNLRERTEIAERLAQAAGIAAANIGELSERALEELESMKDKQNVVEDLFGRVRKAESSAKAYLEQLRLVQEDASKDRTLLNQVRRELEESKREVSRVGVELRQTVERANLMKRVVDAATSFAATESMAKNATESELSELRRKTENEKEALIRLLSEKLSSCEAQLMKLHDASASKEEQLKLMENKLQEYEKRGISARPNPLVTDEKALKDQKELYRRVATAAQEEFALASQENLVLRKNHDALQGVVQAAQKSTEQSWAENNELREGNKKIREKLRQAEANMEDTVRSLRERLESAERSARIAADAATLLREQNQALSASGNPPTADNLQAFELAKAELAALQRAEQSLQKELENARKASQEAVTRRQQLEADVHDLRVENENMSEQIRTLNSELQSTKVLLDRLMVVANSRVVSPQSPTKSTEMLNSPTRFSPRKKAPGNGESTASQSLEGLTR